MIVFEALLSVSVPQMYSHFLIVCLMFGVVMRIFFLVELFSNSFFHCSSIFSVDVDLLDTS